MNRAERRRNKRQEKKDINILHWVDNLPYDKKKAIYDTINGRVCEEIEVLFNVWEMALRVGLNEEFTNIEYSEQLVWSIIDIVKKFSNEIGEYKNKGEFWDNMKKNEKEIIKAYELLKSQGKKDKEIYEELWIKFPKVSKNGVKNIILEYLRDNKKQPCESPTCPFVKEGNCTNEVVTSGKDVCRQQNDPNQEVKVSKKTKKEMIEEYFYNNTVEASEEVFQVIAEKFNTSKKYVKEVFGEMVKDIKETPNEIVEEVKIIKPNKKYKVSKIILDGEYGKYEIEDRILYNFKAQFNSKNSIDDYYKVFTDDIKNKIKELKEELDNLENERLEAIDIFNDYIEEE